MTEKNKWSKGYKNTKINQLKFKDIEDEENKNIYNILCSSDTYSEIENKVETIYTDSEKGKIILNSYPILSDLSTK